MDDIKKEEILRQIKAQVNFDPYKTNLSKDVIYEIYNKYFDNDVFVKLNAIDDDSKAYIASGNFNYVPKPEKVDYDLTTYNNLLKNPAFGINSQVDTSKGLK
jgi:DNA-binding Lrp family transcriptional regulator